MGRSSEISQNEIDRANTVNLPQFLMNNGFELERVSRNEYRSKEHDSLHIKDNAYGERGSWYRFSTQKGGDNISFLREFMGKSFAEAVELLNGGRELSHDVTAAQRKKDRAPIVQKSPREIDISVSENTDCKRVLAYLSGTRGLDYNMVAELVKKGMIAQESKTGNALFKAFNEQGKLVGAEKTGTSTVKRFKGIAAGSSGEYGFEVVRGAGEKAYFFESAIDLLSYLQLHSNELDNARLVSMTGVKPTIVENTMQRCGIKPENVYICSDNDEAGNKFAESLREKFPEINRLIPESGKDWNDLLRGIGTEEEIIVADKQTRSDMIWFSMTDKEDMLKTSVSLEQLELLTAEFDSLQLPCAAVIKDDKATFFLDKNSENSKKLVELLAGRSDFSAVDRKRETASEHSTEGFVKTENTLELLIPKHLATRIARLAEDNKIGFSLSLMEDKMRIAFDENDFAGIYKIYTDVAAARKHLPERIEELERAAELEKVSKEIGSRKKAFADNIGNYSSDDIKRFAAELNELEQQQAELKEKVQTVPIRRSDVDKLRAIEPKRKSVQNLLETEVAQVPKFQTQQTNRRGDKSAFAMREKNGNDWRNDESKRVPIIEVERHPLSNFKADKKNDNLVKRGFFVNDDTGITIAFAKASIEETFSHAMFDAKKHIPVESRVSALYHGEEFIKNAVCFDSVISEFGNNKSPNSIFMHQFYSVYKCEDELYLAKLDVEECLSYNEKGEVNKAHDRLYVLKDIKITPVEVDLGLNPQTYHLNSDRGDLTGVTTISIPQLYELVKTYDKNFFENEQAVGRQERLDEIEVNRTVGKAIDEVQRTAAKEMTGLFSIEQNGEVRYFKTESKANELLKTARGSEKAFIDLSEMGTRISEAEYAEIEQSDRVKYSAGFDLDTMTAEIMAVNKGMGGIAEGDRKDGDLDFYRQSLTAHEKATTHEAEQTASEDRPVMTAPITKEMYHADTAEIHENHDKSTDYILARIEIDTSEELYARLAEHGVKPMEHSLDKVILETDNENWFSLAIPDSYGNIFNNAPAADIFTPEEMSVAREVAETVIGGHIENTRTEQISFDTDEPDFSELVGIDKLTVNGDSVYWEYFNEDGGDGKGQLVEVTLTADDIAEAAKAMEAAGGKTAEGFRAFTDFLTENGSAELTDYGSEDFEAAREHFVNGQFDLTVSGEDSRREIAEFLTNAFPQRTEERAESPIIEDFRAKTDEYFHDIDGKSADDIEALVREHAQAVFADNGIEATVKGVVLDGSRSRGIEHDGSDIDVVMEIESELKEDALFNILHENELTVGGIAVDVNLIKADESGTLEEYLPKAEEYLKNKAHAMANTAENELSDTNGLTSVTDKELAVLLWRNGFDVFVDGDKLPEYVAGGENWEHIERINNSDIVQAYPADIEKEQSIDRISGQVYDLCLKYDNDESLISSYADEAEPRFDWSKTQNVYENVEKALIVGNTQFIEDFLNAEIPLSDELDELLDEIEAYNRKYDIERPDFMSELTENEKYFLECDIVPILAKSALAWDEIESLGYRFFEENYTERNAPSDSSIFGEGLHDPELFALIERQKNGEDISKELVTGLLGGGNFYGRLTDSTERSTFEYTISQHDEGYTLSYGNVSRDVSFKELESAYHDLFYGEWDKNTRFAVYDFLKADIPEITEEAVDRLIDAFDGAKMHGWESGDNQAKINRIKKAINEVLGDEGQTEKAFDNIAKHRYGVKIAENEPVKEEPSLHFGNFGNGITAYDTARIDPETNDYLEVAHISEVGTIKLWADDISAEDMERIKAQAQPLRDKFMSEWNKLSVDEKYNKIVEQNDENYDIVTAMIIAGDREKLTKEQAVEKYTSFVMLREGERPEEEPDPPEATFKIYQLPAGEKYHGIRFEGKEQLEKDGVQLNHDDYELVYEGEIDDFKGKATLEAIFTKFNTDFPEDFKGRALSVSDVVVISTDDKDTAYYVDSFGFKEMPEFFREKELSRDKEPELSEEESPFAVDKELSQELEKVGEQLAENREKAHEERVEALLPTVSAEVVERAANSAEMQNAVRNSDRDNQLIEAEKQFDNVLSALMVENAINDDDDLDVEIEKTDTLRTANALVGRGGEYAEDIISKAAEISAQKEDITAENKPLIAHKVGGFYEFYDRDSEIVAKTLNINRFPKNGHMMSGFPDYMKQSYADKLAAAGFAVEFEQPMDRAMRLINDFCEKEYDSPANFSNPDHVDIAYTTDEDTGLEIQVYADLEAFRLVTEYDGKEVAEELFDSVEDMCGALENLDFNELVSLSDDEKGLTETEITEEKPAEKTDDSKPFWEEQDENGEQLSMFGETAQNTKPEPAPKKEKEYSEGLFVGGVNRFTALHDEITRGTGFVNGKFKVQDFYQKNEPTNREFADFLKKEYGVGGHSGEGNITLVNHDSKGIEFILNTDEKFRFTWADVADMTAEIIDKGEYITQDDLDRRAEREAPAVESKHGIEVGDKFRNRISGEISEVTALSGALEWQTDDVTIETNKGIYSTTENISYERLLNGDIYERVTDVPEREAPAEEKATEEHEAESVKLMEDSRDITEKPAEAEGVRDYDITFRTTNLHDLDDLKSYALSMGAAVTDGEEVGTVTVHTWGDENRDKLTETAGSMGIAAEVNAENDTAAPERSTLYPSGTKLEEEQDADRNADSFVITDDSLGEGGAKTKFRANIEAIKALKTAEAENRAATPEEMEAMSKYVGWGGVWQAFDGSNSNWEKEYAELKEVLTPDEYRSANASVLDAFYTSPVLIDGIYEALGNFGFEGGNVLEPAMGVGNFFGRMPEDMKKHSSLFGREIDSISGRIAQKLYPSADIKIEGFEKNDFQNGCFDIAVGNVPFGDLGFTDNVHKTSKLHDYFFAETLDKVKSGGIAAFITSTGTLDKKDESVRKMLAEKADLIGAVRLPSGAFKANAGTDVTSDIIFLQKRSEPRPAEELPEWVHIGESEEGFHVNSYFAEHPDMILGELAEDSNPRSSGTKVIPFEGAELKELLHEAVGKLSAEISDRKPKAVYAERGDRTVEIPKELRPFSLFEHEGKIHYKTDDRSCEFRFDKKNSVYRRAKAFIAVRDTVRELLSAQEQDKPDTEIKALQSRLNSEYEEFYSKYGLLNSDLNKKYFKTDISYSLVSSLEKSYDLEKGKLYSKSDIFTERTIKPHYVVNHVDSPMEALTLSIAEKGRVDIEYMSKLTELSENEIISQLRSSGEIFKDPVTLEYQTASEYLSGDIREKIRAAEEASSHDETMFTNIKALEAVIPEPLKAGDIDIRLGATWIDPKIYEKFMYELLDTPMSYRSTEKTSFYFWKKQPKIEVRFSEKTGMFEITNKNDDKSVKASDTYGTRYSKKSAYYILEDLLNQKSTKVTKEIEYTDKNGEIKTKRVIDDEKTRIVQSKAEVIQNAFKDWIFKDPERRAQLVEQYNVLFNSVRPREYDGSNLVFPEMNANIELRPHQKNAIAHALFGGNTLFAHAVGAGKTFEMIAAAMEGKRLGLHHKSLFVVPNHLTEQIGADFMRLYPTANILVATKKDFTKENRQKLLAKIATGNFDAVIIGHSQLKFIPLQPEHQERILREQRDDIVSEIAELKQRDGEELHIKALERTRKSIDKQLDKVTKTHYDGVTFEETGIDKLFVDEMHEFKNLTTPTKMNNVSGISSSSAEKATDLFSKVRYLDEKTGGKGFTAATGTPISNTMTELHVMMRYLEYDFLKSKGLASFDGWASVFGNKVTDWQLAPAGNGFREKTRLTYTGLPELMSMFKQVADVRTADTLDLNVPECELHKVVIEPTQLQQDMVEELADRAEQINAGSVDPTRDNMLKVTSDGRKLGLDPRLIDPNLPDDPQTKLNQCVENCARIYSETSEEKLTQIIFCDLGVPHKTSSDLKPEAETNNDIDSVSAAELDSLEEECDFCVYDDLKQKLMARGIPAEEIAFIHDAKTEAQKDEMFAKVRSGDIRIIIGSTAKMGTGTNIQDKLIALHDLDVPWRPADLEQRAGRIIRQGNQNPKVDIYRYVTKGTFDAYSYQTLENKQQFISQVMTSRAPARKCDDVDQQALTYAEIKVLCTGDERIKEKMELESDVKRLKILESSHNNTMYEMQDKVRSLPVHISSLEKEISELKADKEHIKRLPISAETGKPEFSITIGQTTYTDRAEAGKALKEAMGKAVFESREERIGEFQGFPLSVVSHKNAISFELEQAAVLQGAYKHSVLMTSKPSANLARLENCLYNIDRKIEFAQSSIESLSADLKEAEALSDKPFPQKAELEAKSDRLKTVTAELNHAAAEAKKNAPAKEKTVYFARAESSKKDRAAAYQKLRAMKQAQMKAQPKKGKGKSKDHKRDSL